MYGINIWPEWKESIKVLFLGAARKKKCSNYENQNALRILPRRWGLRRLKRRVREQDQVWNSPIPWQDLRDLQNTSTAKWNSSFHSKHFFTYLWTHLFPSAKNQPLRCRCCSWNVFQIIWNSEHWSNFLLIWHEDWVLISEVGKPLIPEIVKLPFSKQNVF